MDRITGIINSENLRPRVVLLGAGNVATHLARALDGVTELCQVWSRTEQSASQLCSGLLSAQPVTDAQDIRRDADFYIISVPDDAVGGVSAMLGDVGGIVAHSSGSVPIDALCQKRRGVFYPLQTFSRHRDVCVREVPFFIEGVDAEALEALKTLAGLISDVVHEADSEHRAVLHLAAVFACNFSNHLWAIAEEQLRKGGYDLSVFSPLLHETLRKALTNGASKSQTGPAVRGDYAVIRTQLSKLSGDSAELYQLMTRMIIDAHRSD